MKDLQDFLLDTLRGCDGLTVKQLRHEAKMTSWAAQQTPGGKGFICGPAAIDEALVILQAKGLVDYSGGIWEALRVKTKPKQANLF